MTVPHSQQVVISLTRASLDPHHGCPIEPLTTTLEIEGFQHKPPKYCQEQPTKTLEQLIGNLSHHYPFSASGSELAAGWEGIAKGNGSHMRLR